MCWKFEASGDKNLVIQALLSARPVDAGAHDEPIADQARALILLHVEQVPADRVSVLAVGTGMSMQVSVGMYDEAADWLPTDPPSIALP